LHRNLIGCPASSEVSRSDHLSRFSVSKIHVTTQRERTGNIIVIKEKTVDYTCGVQNTGLP